jgi:signal transduction histidine kinase
MPSSRPSAAYTPELGNVRGSAPNTRPHGASNAVSRSSILKLSRGRPGHLLDLAARVTRAACGGMVLLSPQGELVEHATVGVPEFAVGELSRSAWLAAVVRLAQLQAEPTCLRDAAAVAAEPPGLAPLGPLLVVPLMRPGRIRGALYLARPAGAPAFDARDLELVQPVGECLAGGGLYEESHLLAQLRLLNQVAQAAANHLSLTPLLDTALRELDRNLPMSLCAFWVPEDPPVQALPVATAAAAAPGDDEPRLVLAAVSPSQGRHARELGLVPGLALPLGRTPFTPCWRQGGAVYSAWGRPEQMREVWRQPAAEPAAGLPCFATPLRVGEQPVGILLAVCNRPGGFTSEQVQMLYLFADLMGPAISNCRLFARLRSTCEELRTTQQQLVRTEKLRALGELAGGMAHEFNNSLCGVLGFIELTLSENDLSHTCRGHLNMARTSALDAAQTVRRVQDFARARRDDLGYQSLDLNQLVRETVELTRSKWEHQAHLEGRTITLALRTEASRPVRGNASELREVLTNLIFNAVDAMPRGGNLIVTAASRDGAVFVTVTDTGVGMSPAVQQRLFEPFFTTKGEKGNGLGLSVAFGLVRQHSGEITVASEVGRGSTFTVRLPATEETVPAPPSPGTAVPPPVAGLRAGGLNVLVVEDEEAVQRFLRLVLQQLGHRPRVVGSGQEALDLLARERFDLVLTDLGLPDISGEVVARTVRECAPQTPVVLLTGWADQLKAEERAPAGVTRVLGKPVTIKGLTEVLTELAPH